MGLLLVIDYIPQLLAIAIPHCVAYANKKSPVYDKAGKTVGDSEQYTTFILLYPIGVTGELLCLYAAQKEVSETGLWSINLPNSLNFTFHYHHFLLMIMALYIPFFPQLYMHMFTLRKKVLGSNDNLVTINKQE